MISWSIQSAISSGCFDKVVVSTDCNDTADIAGSCGAEVPFIRPAELADDLSPTRLVVAHD